MTWGLLTSYEFLAIFYACPTTSYNLTCFSSSTLCLRAFLPFFFLLYILLLLLLVSGWLVAAWLLSQATSLSFSFYLTSFSLQQRTDLWLSNLNVLPSSNLSF